MSKNTRTLEEMITEHYGERGTPKREKLERGYLKFKAKYLRDLEDYKGEFTELPPFPTKEEGSIDEAFPKGT